VRYAVRCVQPGPVMLASALLRMAALLGGLYTVAGDRWTHMLQYLLGVLIARLVVTWYTRHVDTVWGAPATTQRPTAMKAPHAP
jgi:F1F0 ATPase subunit 2